MKPKISIRNLSKSFQVAQGQFQALSNIDLPIFDQEFLCIVGPSGCGKSTLLRILGGLEEPSEGKVYIDHEDRSRPQNTMIFQEESVFPWLTVEKNAAYGLRVANNWNGRESQERIDYFLGKAGLLQFRKFYPYQLSGGMKQRLSVVRAFVTNPEILLMDEPFAALDEQNKLLLQHELGRLWEEFKSTVVFITHSIEEAVLLGDRLIVMTSAPGRLKHSMTIPFDRPRDIVALRRTPEFNEIVLNVWEALRDEVQKARENEIGRLAKAAGG